QINVATKNANPLRGFRRGPGPDGQQPQTPKELEELLKRFFGEDGPPGLRPEGYQFKKQDFIPTGTGSGFVYDGQGHILTNNHVVENADKITVTFHDGIEAEAKVVGRHPETDVAILKVDQTSYRPLPKGQSSKLRVGEWVLAVGSPFGLDQ